MIKTIFISILFIINNFLFSQPPTIVGTPLLNISGKTLPMYEKFELDLKLNRTVPNDYKAPHDSDEVSLYAVFKNNQSGHSFKSYLFYNEPYIEQANPCTWPLNKQPDAMFPNSSFSTSGNSNNNYLQSWKMRCAFKETGSWNFTIFGKDKYAPDSFIRLYSDSVVVSSPNPGMNGFIRKSDNNNTYLFFDNGKMCFLNGVNEFFAENKETFICRMKGLIDKMTANNINFMRIWIDGNPGWYYTADIQGEALNDLYCTSIFNQRAAKILDEIIDYARLKNMYIQPCLYAPCLSDEGWNKGFTYQNAFNANNPKHNTGRNNTPNVGEIANPWEFFNPSILKYMRNYIKYVTSRWGYATNIVGWEIGNEVNPSNATLSVLNVTTPYKQPAQFSAQLKEWHKNFKKYLNYYDAHSHLVTTSLQAASGRSAWKNYPVTYELYDIFSLMDYTNSHNYYINPTCPEKSNCEKLEEQEDANFSTNAVFHSEMSKPTQVQEWGLGDDKCNPNIPDRGYFELDPFGISHHNVVLSSAFAGGMGTACTFNTWADVQPGDYYYHYKGIGEFMNKFGNLGNPLYVKKERSLFDNRGNNNCSNTDFSNEGLRYYYMANSNKLVIGWCQDKRFSFARLYWRDIDDNLNYLKTFEKRFKPSTENSSNIFTIKVPQKGYYKISWYQPLDIKIFIQKDIIVRTSSPNVASEQFLKLELPKSLHNDKLADGLFAVQYYCEQKLNFSITSGPAFNYGDKIPIHLNEFVAIDEVELTVERVNDQQQFIETLFIKKINAKDFSDSIKRELNYLYNSTQPSHQNIPYLNNQTTYYRIKITPTNPNNLSECIVSYNSEPIYFQITGCNSKPMLKINGFDGSTISNPITVQHGEPVNLDVSGSYGGTGYRIIIREIDVLNKYLGPEYNVLHEGKPDKITDANAILRESTNNLKHYLPSDGPANFRLYQIYHVNFNSYPPSNGCSSWEETSEFVKVNCTANVNLTISDAGGNASTVYAYAEPVYMDGRKSTGETGYKIIIQQTDSNGNNLGTAYFKSINGKLDSLINLNTILNEVSNGTIKYLPPSKSGPSYFKIILGIYNTNGEGGCEIWKSDSTRIKILSCHIMNQFYVNKDGSGNTFSNPVTYKHGEPLLMDARGTKGETGFKLRLNRFDKNGNRVNNYSVLYNHPISETYELNKWYNENFDSTLINLPSYTGNSQNIWQISLLTFNAKNNQGCDDSVVNTLFFKTEKALNCEFILNTENPQNHQNNIEEICDDEGTFLNPLPGYYGCDQYTVTMDELEYATWLSGSPKPLVTYERHINNQPQYFNRKRTFETFKSSVIEPINLEELWYRRTGSKIDKTKHYKVTLTTNDNTQNCSDIWTFTYKSCTDRPKGINPKKPEANQLRQASKLPEIKISKTSGPDKILLYPNPASSFINFQKTDTEISEASIEIFDICSKNMLTLLTSEQNLKIDLSTFNSGIYFMKVTINNNFYNYKIIKLCD